MSEVASAVDDLLRIQFLVAHACRELLMGRNRQHVISHLCDQVNRIMAGHLSPQRDTMPPEEA